MTLHGKKKVSISQFKKVPSVRENTFIEIITATAMLIKLLFKI